jgi:hypothetical protein
MSTIMIRRPTAPPPERTVAPAYTLDRALAGRRIGLRTDTAWRSWALIADEWEKRIRDEGADVLCVETGAQVGDHGRADRQTIEEWSQDIDGGLVGLGTCGSCTSFTIKDAVTLERHGKPSIAVVTEEFETHARNMARFLGHGDLKVLVLPYPLEARPDDELRQIAADFYGAAMDLLGVTR